MNFANSVPVELPDLVSFRDPLVERHNVTDGRSGGVATSIADKNQIWRASPSDIGTAATHADLKNINDKLAFRKYLNELDLETIQMFERDHRARENMENIVTRLRKTRIDEQKMEERETVDDIPTRIETIQSEPISDTLTQIETIHEPKVTSDPDPPPSNLSDSSSSDSETN